LNRLVGIITDFGLQDSYVSEIKAVIYKKCTNVHIIDITHQVASGDIAAGAYLLGRVVHSFPDGSLFVAVIDPGVGTERQAVIIRNNQRFFIGPDNGIFTRAINWNIPIDVRICTLDNVDGIEISATFHGRDLFAPLAAKLACGTTFEDIGEAGILKETFKPNQASRTDNGWQGEVVYIDKFGNIATNLPNNLSGYIKIKREINLPFAKTYSEQPVGEPLWLYGSDGCIEIAINQGHAGNTLDVQIGNPVEIFHKGS